MTSEELYKKEFGNAESIPKESVIRLLKHFARVLEGERKVVNKTCNIPHVIDMRCPYCHSDDIVWYGLSGDCVCNKCGKEGSIIL